MTQPNESEQYRIHPIEEELHAIEGYKSLKFSSRMAIFQKIDDARKAARPLTERITDMALMEALSPPQQPLAWQPMGTLKQDGREFIGLNQNGMVYKCKYFDTEQTDYPPRLGFLTYSHRRSKSYECVKIPEPMLVDLNKENGNDSWDVPTVTALIHRTTEEHEDLHYTFWQAGLTHNFIGWLPLPQSSKEIP